MKLLWWKRDRTAAGQSAAVGIRERYSSFRELLALNNECLELMAGLQEDLQYGPPSAAVLGTRIADLFDKTAGVVAQLQRLSGDEYRSLAEAVAIQRQEVERQIATRHELAAPNLSAWLSEVDATRTGEVGGKAAALGEIKNRLRLPVPDGYVLTAEAYRQFCGIPLWEQIRDATHNVDLNDLEALRDVSARLTDLVMASPVPRSIEVAITERAASLRDAGIPIAVRSSAAGEGGERTFAGQFLSLINVPADQMIDGYKRVVAGRFSERALSYRLSFGVPEVENPMAVLFLRVVPANSSGVMYTRDPKDPRSAAMWVTSTRGLGLDIASGRVPADLFVLERRPPHNVVEQNIVHKTEQIVLGDNEGVVHRPTPIEEADEPSLLPPQLQQLADWGVRIEQHFGVPQDIEWAMDHDGQLWILQARPLVLGDGSHHGKARVKGEPVLAGGRTVYAGRVSGPAFLVSDLKALSDTPERAILFLRKASPEIVTVFSRISGVVAELGNVAGHAAALLRESKIPSVFQLAGAFESLSNGDPVSLDAVQPRIYRGTFWAPRAVDSRVAERYQEKAGDTDPINRRLLTLHLLDPSAHNFRPSGCQSAHDVLRFCHEKAIEEMFAVNDSVIGADLHLAKKLMATVPVNISVLDLGGGLAMDDPTSPEVEPSQIVSRPFQALWRGLSHPAVSWQRDMPASLSDFASVMATSLTSQSGITRALGDRSYLLVADEYMNLNSRLAYHFTLVDACVSDVAGQNYISFRFAGGGAAPERRNLRASFIESCLAQYGFLVDRRGDLVNAWFKKAPAEATECNLDILGRLMACASQLDMYMTSASVAKWYVRQFLAGNYSFSADSDRAEQAHAQGHNS